MRLDKYLAAHGFSSRTKAARAISDGRVMLNGKLAAASDEVREGDLVVVEDTEVSFVSEGGFKLYKALRDFGESVGRGVFADIGASTGGFTDCLLQGGAKRVYAIDVGESQLDEKLRKDPRVCVMDKCNARYLKREDLAEKIDGVAIDVSFISLKLLFEAVSGILPEHGRLFALIKPQFECGPKALDKHGVVKSSRDRSNAVISVCNEAAKYGLYVKNLTCAPLKPRKNIEYMALFTKNDKDLLTNEALEIKSRI